MLSERNTQLRHLVHWLPNIDELKRWLLVAAFAFALVMSGLAQTGRQVGTIYIKNNGQTPVQVWVAGAYQGYVPAGQTMFTTKEGFDTRASGFLNDGSLYQRHSHGGWGASGMLTVTLKSQDARGTKYNNERLLNPADGDEWHIWTGESSPGGPPTAAEVELSSQILKGNLESFGENDEEMAEVKSKRARLEELLEDQRALRERIANARDNISDRAEGLELKLSRLREEGGKEITTEVAVNPSADELRSWELDVERIRTNLAFYQDRLRSLRSSQEESAGVGDVIYSKDQPVAPAKPSQNAAKMITSVADDVERTESALVEILANKPTKRTVKQTRVRPSNRAEISRLERELNRARAGESRTATEVEAWKEQLRDAEGAISALEDELKKDGTRAISARPVNGVLRKDALKKETERRALLDSLTDNSKPKKPGFLLDAITTQPGTSPTGAQKPSSLLDRVTGGSK